MQNGFLLKDASLVASTILPVGAAVTTSTAIDLQNSANGDFVAEVEFDLAAPVLTTGQAPDTKTITYDVIHSVNSNLSSAAVLLPGVIVQTGAGGAGAGASTFRFRVPHGVRRYLGFQATGVATVSAAGATATLTPKF